MISDLEIHVSYFRGGTLVKDQNFDPGIKTYLATTISRTSFKRVSGDSLHRLKAFPNGESNVGNVLFDFTNGDITLMTDDGKHVAACYEYGDGFFLVGMLDPEHEYTQSLLKQFASFTKKKD